MEAYIENKNFITVMYNNNSQTIGSDHISFKKIKKALYEGNYKEAIKLADITEAIKEFFDQSKLDIQKTVITYDGKPIHGTLVDKIMEMMKDGFSVGPLVNFLSNTLKNPSSQSIEELYDFILASKLPITEDGYFLAYKAVNKNFKDMYTGDILNTVGSIVEMPREEVNSNRNETCSTGLHFCGFDYLAAYANSDSHTMILKISPEDVVSIPSDYDNLKGRCCKYEVIGEFGKQDVKLEKSTVAKTKTKKPIKKKIKSKAKTKVTKDSKRTYNTTKCPYCKKDIGNNNYKRYHGDNCKHKK